jgi:uncharacterized protein involved in outer membrane biogenesis
MPKPAWWRGRGRWPLLCTVLLLVAASGLVLGLPPLVKHLVETRGSALLGRDVRLDAAEVSFLRLTVTLHGLRVAGARGDADAQPQLEVRRLHADISQRSLWRWAPVVEAFSVEAPRLRLARLGPGRLDIDDLVQRLQRPADPAAPVSGEPARFALFNLRLLDGAVTFDDRLVGRTHVLQGVQAAVPFLSNLPEDIPVHVLPRLAFRFADAAVDLSGRVLPFSDDRASELQLQWQPLALDDFWAYLPPALGLRLQGGQLGAALTLRFAQPQGQQPVLALSGRIELRDLAMDGAVTGTRAALRSLRIGLADVQPLLRRVALDEVAVEGLTLALLRDAQGQLQGPAPAALRDSRDTPPPAGAHADGATAARAGDSGPAEWVVSLRSLALREAGVQLLDRTVAPAAAWHLRDLNLGVENLRWPAQAPWPVRLQGRMLAGERRERLAAMVDIQGQAGPDAATLDLALAQLDLAAAGPYLARWLKPRLQGEAALQAQLVWVAGVQPRLELKAAKARIAPLRLSPSPGFQTGPLAGWRELEVQDASIDLLARRVTIGRLRLDRPELALRRDQQGRVDIPGGWQAAVRPSTAAAAAERDEQPPWQFSLEDLLIERGRVWFQDLGPVRPVDLGVHGLRLRLQGLDWPARQRPVRFSLAAMLADTGSPPGAVGGLDAQARAPGTAAATLTTAAQVRASGALGLQPARFDGDLAVERLPLQAFEPYFRAALPVRLARAELGWQGRIRASVPAGGGAPQVVIDAQGVAQVADLDLRSEATAAAPAGGELDEQPGEQLVGWSLLQLQPLRVVRRQDEPWLVEIGEVALSDFYSRLVITEQGQFNLRDVQATGARPLAQPPDAAAAAAAAETAPTSTAVAAAAASAPVSVPTKAADAAQTPGSDKPAPFTLVVGSTRLSGGRVDFTDRFIRPNYSAELTELTGTIGRFASSSPGELATVDLRGRVAGTGRLEVRGAFNPTANPLALDIQARTTELELAPLSPYSGKYAGYAIERGKLSVDLAYRVAPDGALQARNQIILNQLTFGPAVDSPDATKLPVRLAVALLTDRRGVIDLDLPVSGSINDPQFSIWGIVWKIVGNLLSKALTAPFALLAGGGEDVSRVAFLPGTTQWVEGTQPVLERIVRALQDRPALQLTLSGHADAAAEREAIQAAVVDARLLSEHRRERARAGQTADAASQTLADLSAQERQRLLDRVYADAPMPGKPRNPLGLLKAVPAAEKRARLEAAVPVSEDVARELALQRALRLRDALMALGMPSERLFLGAPKATATPSPESPTPGDPATAGTKAAATKGFEPRVELLLAVP